MNARLPLALVLAASLCEAATAAQAAKFTAMSQTATSITGNVTLGASGLGMAGNVYALKGTRTLDAAHAKTAGSVVSALDPVTSATVSAIAIPHTVKLLGGNTLCGADDTRWVVAVHTKGGLSLAFYSSATAPALATPDDPGLCGTFGYTQP